MKALEVLRRLDAEGPSTNNARRLFDLLPEIITVLEATELLRGGAFAAMPSVQAAFDDLDARATELEEEE